MLTRNGGAVAKALPGRVCTIKVSLRIINGMPSSSEDDCGSEAAVQEGGWAKVAGSSAFAGRTGKVARACHESAEYDFCLSFDGDQRLYAFRVEDLAPSTASHFKRRRRIAPARKKMRMPRTAGNPPVGWYDDADGMGSRYWNGVEWTSFEPGHQRQEESLLRLVSVILAGALLTFLLIAWAVSCDDTRDGAGGAGVATLDPSAVIAAHAGQTVPVRDGLIAGCARLAGSE